MNKADIAGIVINRLVEILSEENEEVQLEPDTLNEFTHLLGRCSVLDSLGLVKLIVNIEQQLNDDFGYSITIADDRAMSQEKSPFRTVGSLADYIALLVNEQV